jgi:hypothetical protein
MTRCGFPGAPTNCKGALSFVDNPAHVQGLAGGGHAVVDGKVFLCAWHGDVICTAMAQRGVRVVTKKLVE